MRKKISLLILVTLISVYVNAQMKIDSFPKNTIISIDYGNEMFMNKHVSGNSWVLKKGIDDGIWIAYYDKKHQDTAIVAYIINGLIQGVYREWDEEDHYVWLECEYDKGVPNGLWKDFLFIEGNFYYSVIKYEHGLMGEEIKVEELMKLEDYPYYIPPKLYKKLNKN